MNYAELSCKLGFFFFMTDNMALILIRVHGVKYQSIKSNVCHFHTEILMTSRVHPSSKCHMLCNIVTSAVEISIKTNDLIYMAKVSFKSS